MNRTTLIVAIASVGLFAAFWMYNQNQMAQERCMMSGGQWSSANKACSN